jgi:hypothetical protein
VLACISRADLKRFDIPAAPIKQLGRLVYRELSAYGRALGALAALEHSYAGVRSTAALRESLIERFSTAGYSQEETAKRYFGFALPDGSIDQQYADRLRALIGYIDDVAVLQCFANRRFARSRFARKRKIRSQFGHKNSPTVSDADFSKAREIGLLAPMSQYGGWLAGFSDLAPQPAQSIWNRFVAKLRTWRPSRSQPRPTSHA